MKLSFEEVSIRARKLWKDEAGLRHVVTRRFYQTLNQFNRTADGSVKTREQILVELIAERDAWLHEVSS